MKKMKRKLGFILLLCAIMSNAFAQDSITLIGKLSYTGIPIHDINRYVDTVTNIPYALLCASTSGMKVIDISNPANPVQTGATTGSIYVVDVGTFKQYAYTVAENITSTSGRIVDLSNPAAPVQVGIFQGAHTVHVTPNGYMYLESPGLKIYDLNPNPLVPQLVYNDPSCIGHDVTIVGNRLYDFSNNCGTRIYDLSQPDTAVFLGQVPSLGIFHHSGYPSSDGNYLYVCDELSSPTENDITVWDISNPATPFFVDSFADASAYIHNFYIIDNYAYVSYYRNGFKVFDVSNPLNITLVDTYDTDSTLSGPGYGGNYGLHIFSPDATILASDENKGLYIFKFSGLQTNIKEDLNIADNLKIFPNPSSGNFFIEYTSESNEAVKTKIIDVLGKELYSSESRFQTIGVNKFEINTPLKNGMYSIVLISKNVTISKKIIINN